MSELRYGVLPPDGPNDLSGLELMRGILDGRFPQAPVCEAGHFRLHEVNEGFVAFVGMPKADFYNPLGTVHGGWISMLLDSCMSCAVHTRVPRGQAYTTVELKVNFVRPPLESTGEMRAEGRVIHMGARIATAEGRLTDAAGKLYAHGTVTCMVFPMPSAKA